MIKIAPSILSADFANLYNDVDDVCRAGADYLHIDVMDGVFVPNITVGIPVVKALRQVTDMVLDVHLMITKPINLALEFCRAGADILVFHLEAQEPQESFETIKIIRGEGKRPGLSIKPKTPALSLLPYIELIDLVTVMTVEPGFGGQSFLMNQLPKLAAVNAMIEDLHPGCELESDGGINPETAVLAAESGAGVLVAGSAIFGKNNRADAIDSLRPGKTRR